VPELAAHFPRISNHGRSYRFVLRKGIRYNWQTPGAGSSKLVGVPAGYQERS
jgi:hypothetical protein